MNDRLFDEISNNTPLALHPDNITAIVVRAVGNGDETALPAPGKLN